MSVEPEPLPITGPPRWVKVFAIAALVVVVLFVVLLIVGGGQHGPARHGAGSPGLSR